MKLPKFFIYILLLVLFAGAQFAASAQSKRDPNRCKNLTLTIETTNAKPALAKGGVLEVTFTGNQGKVRCFLLNKAGDMVNDKDYFRTRFEGLKPDRYTIIITDSQGCTTEKEFEIR
jgi:hypothetical protein